MKEKRWLKYLCLFALALILAIPAAGAKEVFAETTSGSCGDKATYEYDSDTKTLTLSGSGAVEAPDEWSDIAGSVKYLVVGDKITDIGTFSGAYDGWTALKTVTLGKKVKKINNDAFRGCSALTTVDMSTSAVTKIGEYAFIACEKLKTVTLNKKVTKISAYAFSYCTKLTSITLPSSLTTIGSYAFEESGLKSISLPSSLTTIGKYAFEGSALKKVTIPKSVTSIGTGAFVNCENLTKITVSSSNTKYSAKSGVLYNKEKTKLITYPAGKSSTSFTVPSTVTTIGVRAFYGVSNLKTIDLNKVKKISDYAFTSSSLTKITIPKTVTKIGEGAFWSCTKLKSVTIGAGVKSIGEYAFADCSALKTVKFKGSAPEFASNSDYGVEMYFEFMGDTTTVKYPASEKSSWTKTLRTNLKTGAKAGGGKLTFKSY